MVTYLPCRARRTLVQQLVASVDRTVHAPLLAVLDDQFGGGFVDEITERMCHTTHNTRWSAADRLSNCVAYLLARATMPNVRDDLVANLGPDEAWHTFILYVDEYVTFCDRLCGGIIHHDPAGEAARVNDSAATAHTLDVFGRFRIPYTAALWRDAELYAGGVQVIRAGFLATSRSGV